MRIDCMIINLLNKSLCLHLLVTSSLYLDYLVLGLIYLLVFLVSVTLLAASPLFAGASICCSSPPCDWSNTTKSPTLGAQIPQFIPFILFFPLL